MAHLWRQHDGEWATVGLDALGGLAVGVAAGPEPVVVRAAGGGWFLAAPVAADVAVNGERVATGLVALADRDELRLADGTRLFFSAESAATIEVLAAPPPDLRCPRCRRGFVPASPVVRCPAPGCGVVHHESERLPCFTYANRCAVCPQPTRLDAAAPRWTPEDL